MREGSWSGDSLCHSACSLLVTATSLSVSVSVGSGPRHRLVASALSSAVWPPPFEFRVKPKFRTSFFVLSWVRVAVAWVLFSSVGVARLNVYFCKDYKCI